MQRLNICMITPSLYPITIGGPSNVTFYLARELNRCGLTLKIIYEVSRVDQTQISLLRNIIGTEDGTELIPLQLTSERLARIVLMPSVFRLIVEKMRDIDIVHFQTYPDALPYSSMLALIKARHIPCVLSYHGSTLLKIKRPGETRTLPESLRLSYILLTKKLFDAVIVPSISMAQRTELEGFKGEKIRAIPNGVDINKFQGIQPMKLDGEPAILWVGYSEWDKGVDIALRTMKFVLHVIPTARLHFVGPYHSGFHDELKREGLESVMRVHGCILPSKMPSYYAGADICINPSRWESFSLTMLEAMAAGKPVVASRVGGMKELINDEVNGLLVRPEAKSFSEAIVRLCNDIDLRTRIAQNAVKRAEEFSWSSIVSHYLRLYAELVGN